MTAKSSKAKMIHWFRKIQNFTKLFGITFSEAEAIEDAEKAQY